MWHDFPTEQAPALECWTRLSPDQQKHALVMAFDSGGAGGTKRYAVGDYFRAYQLLFALDAPRDLRPWGECMYELLRHDVPLRLYYDIDIERAANPALDDTAVWALHSCFTHHISEAVAELGCAIPLLHIETSHKSGVKWSIHGKLAASCGVFADMEAQRAFWAHVHLKIEHTQARLFVTKKDKKGERVEQIWDHGVYTLNRLMRVLGATKFYDRYKRERPRWLLPEGVEQRAAETIPWEMWRESLITNVGESARIFNVPPAWYEEIKLVFGPSKMREIHALTLRREREAVDKLAAARAFFVKADAQWNEVASFFKDCDLSTYEIVFTRLQGNPTRGVYVVSIDELRHMLLWDGRLSNVVSLHIVPPFSDWLIIDVDVREYVRKPAQCSSARHATCAACSRVERWPQCQSADHGTCAECWRVASAIVQLICVRMQRDYRFALPTIFFSGSGGVHLWFRLGTRQHIHNFRDARTRRLLVETLLVQSTRLHPVLTHFGVRATDLSVFDFLPPDDVPTKIDAGPTCAPHHAIRMPFMWNEKKDRPMELLHYSPGTPLALPEALR
jgi:hypothetical protein